MFTFFICSQIASIKIYIPSKRVRELSINIVRRQANNTKYIFIFVQSSESYFVFRYCRRFFLHLVLFKVLSVVKRKRCGGGSDSARKSNLPGRIAKRNSFYFLSVIWFLVLRRHTTVEI